MENRNIPVTPLPNPGEGGAVFPGSAENIPAIPLPNPGEGGAVFPGSPSVQPGGVIAIQPLPGFIVPARYAAARFLNATHGYPPLRVLIDGVRAVNLLDSGTASGYLRIPAGQHLITVRGQDGYIYIEQTLRFSSGSFSTVVILNRSGGLELRQITDIFSAV